MKPRNHFTSDIFHVNQHSIPLRRIMRISTRNKPIFFVIGALVFFLLFKWFRNDELNWDIVGPPESAKVQRNPDLKHDKWIIVTTIRSPSPSIKKLAQISGWKLLVVADRKTPKSWDFPGAILLDIKSQKDLRYQVHSYLPYDSYARKIIGYLYAIEHGALYIYETDDDNFPDGDLSQFHIGSAQSDFLLLQTKNTTYNPFVHFGQGTMWPRGLPLDHIGLPSSRQYSLCHMHAPAIQQGLVNGDPDVDALFRLTRKHGSEDLKVQFDGVAPPVVLPYATYSPFNTQNTLFSFKAFWALVLPVSVSMRSADIFRSYWAQTLLWTVGSNVGFFSPQTSQKRNPHSLILDAYDEADLYHHMSGFVSFMEKWKCDKMFFFDCVSLLSHDLVERGYFKRQDADLIDAWITDLATIGYASPVLKSKSNPCSDKSSIDVIFYPDEQLTVLPHSTQRILPSDLVNHQSVKKYLIETCGFETSFHWDSIMHRGEKFEDELLVISLQSAPGEIIPALEATYRPHYPHILYCGVKLESKHEDFIRHWKVSYVTPKTHLSGVSCVQTAMSMHFNAKAFVHITESMYLNMHSEKLLNKMKHLTWVTAEIDAYRPEMVKLCKEGTINCTPMDKEIISKVNRYTNEIDLPNDITAKIKQCFDKLRSDPSFQGQPTLTWVTDMTFRIPASAEEQFLKLAQHYAKDSQMRQYDFFTLLLMECLQHTVEYMSYGDGREGSDVQKQTDYLFPYAFKMVELDEGQLNNHFCGHFEEYSPNEHI